MPDSDGSSSSQIQYPLDEPRKPTPKWVPISMFVTISAAMGVPLILLLRIRRGLGPSTVLRSGKSAPPIRSASSSSSTMTTATSSSQMMTPIQPITQPTTLDPSVDDSEGYEPNMGFLAFRAFSMATLMVTTGAVVTVLGIKQWLGVKNTAEFAQEMRHQMMHQLPFITQRINRSLSTTVDPQEIENWEWESAETRLRHAYETQGVSGWFNTVSKELEIEAEVNRRQRCGESKESTKDVK